MAMRQYQLDTAIRAIRWERLTTTAQIPKGALLTLLLKPKDGLALVLWQDKRYWVYERDFRAHARPEAESTDEHER